ncbi:hypothetical protein ACEWY4_015562 [Coilia grayii]|uniref:Metalloendopeptidase n=1 Tax=Coilia grayii TaxID=363190 RepID=A0ABD1JND0_9TELE
MPGSAVCLVCVDGGFRGKGSEEEEEEEEDLPVSVQLQRANFGLVHGAGEPPLVDDIAMDAEMGRLSDSCVSRGCMWPKSKNGKVHVPYVISNDFSAQEKSVIQRGLDSFTSSTCVRFKPRQSERDYIAIYSKNGCYSYIGRRGGEQAVSLSRKGCLHHGTIQHELLHTLGFNHEQTRSDRDKHIRIMWDNILDDKWHNFHKAKTLNQNTPYDYNSVMQYHMFAFSKNRKPTMIPIPDTDVDFGKATQMSENDIIRVNRLYKCLHQGPVAMATSTALLLLCLLGILLPVQSQELKPVGMKDNGPVGHISKDGNYTASILTETPSWVNKDAGLQVLDDVEVTEGDLMEGDLAGFRNADPCTSSGCKWPRSPDGLVHVPYFIAWFSPGHIGIIQKALQDFAKSTCVRFRRLQTYPRDSSTVFVFIRPGRACWAQVGYTGRRRSVTLNPQDCVLRAGAQHQALQVLGFDHEHTRSDRDSHVRIIFQNIVGGQEHQFQKKKTNNLGTAYDYTSVTHFSRYAYSGNGLPTIVPIPDPDVVIGRATQMSTMDILRVNRLYGCRTCVSVMAVFRFAVCVLALLLVSVWAEEVEENLEELPISELLHRANTGLTLEADEPYLLDDIAVDSESERNADPCTSRGCLWPKSSDGKVYVPVFISNDFSSREKAIIERGLSSFSSMSCIRFKTRTNQKDYLGIYSKSGCYSYVGRRGGQQVVSLSRRGCLYHKTVQHELLHALGFNHEQTRSDRDNHIRVMWDNVIQDKKHNFNKINTLNQNTPYDYNSVMQYSKYAFSKNNRPTMVPIPNNNVEIGKATEMSQNDINRLNRLYKCCE